MTASWATWLGLAAAALTTFAFVPQLFKIEKERSTELSAAMLGMYLSGQVLWLVYGVTIGAVPIIVANATSIALVTTVSIRRRRASRSRALRR